MKAINKNRVISLILAVVIVCTGILCMPARSEAASAYVIYGGNLAEDIELEKGQQITLYAHNFSGLVNWISSDSSVLTVLSRPGSECIVKAMGGGDCTLTALDNSLNKVEIKISVGSFQVKEYLSLGIGGKGKVCEGKAKGKVKFKCTNKKVCKVSKKGVVTAKKAGTAKIKVSVKGGSTYTCTVKVQKVSFDENFRVQMVKTGGTFEIGLQYLSNQNYSISVEDESIASFNGTTGTGLRQGRTDYTVTCNGQSYKCTIYVLDSEDTTFAAACPANLTIKSGSSVEIPCYGAWSGIFTLKGDNSEVCSETGFEDAMNNPTRLSQGIVKGQSWYSSFKVNGLEPGECTIKIYDNTGTLQVTLNVTVVE